MNPIITNDEWEMRYSNAIENNDLAGVREAVETGGVSVECVMDDGFASLGIMHCASNGFYEIAEYLLQKGASVNVIGWGGATPATIAKSQGHSELAELVNSYMATAIAPEVVQSKAEVFKPDARGNANMDHPYGWQNFDRLVAKLNTLGERLTREDLLQPNARGVSWLEKAAQHGELSRVLEYLDEIEQPLTMEHLVQSRTEGEGVEPTPLLGAIAGFRQANALFQPEIWDGKSPRELRVVFNVLPEDVQATVNNYHTLHAELSRNARQMHRAAADGQPVNEGRSR